MMKEEAKPNGTEAASAERNAEKPEKGIRPDFSEGSGPAETDGKPVASGTKRKKGKVGKRAGTASGKGRSAAQPLTPTQIIRRRRERVLIRRGYAELAVRIAVLAAAAWVLFTKVFLITQVSGNGMFPSVKDGDLIIGYRLQRDYVKDDVIVYTAEGKTRIGRITARWDDYVKLDDSGTLLVNGTVQSGEILYPTYAKPGLTYPYRVPEKSVFVLGDYRTQTEDSRDFGPIALSDVKGKVITILRRRGL